MRFWTARLPLRDGPSNWPTPEVRQIVTFQFAPGRMAEALAIYRDQLRPIYEGIPALLRFRGYSEAESPEPLDLIVVSSYRGMAGMDLAKRDFAVPLPRARRPSRCTGPCPR